MDTPVRAPDYVVLHNNVGGLFNQGDVIPPGTYSEEQLARLVGLGAIEAVDPVGENIANPVKPSVDVTTAPSGAEMVSPARSVPQSAEEFKAAEDAKALAAAGRQTGDLSADIDDDQRAALAEAGFGTAEAVRNATDEDLLAVRGIGKATLQKLREAR